MVYNKTMNNLYYLAQYTSSTATEEELYGTVAFGAVFVLSLVFSAILYAIVALLLSQIFHKAGLARWAAWVPFYNTWKVFELGGQHGALSLLTLFPIVQIVGLVFMYIAMYHIGLKLGKSGAFVIWGIFLPIVWYIWLAVDQSTWNEQAPGAAPSLATGPKPSGTATV